MMGDADRGVVELRDGAERRHRAPKNYQAALLVVVFIVGLFLGLIAGRSMVPEDHPYYLPSEIPPATE